MVVKFKDVRLSYDPNKEFEVLKGISFEIRKNEKVAFIGRTGSGKTSIFNSCSDFCMNFTGQLRSSQYGRPKSMPLMSSKNLSKEVRVIVEARGGRPSSYSMLFLANIFSPF